MSRKVMSLLSLLARGLRGRPMAARATASVVVVLAATISVGMLVWSQANAQAVDEAAAADFTSTFDDVHLRRTEMNDYAGARDQAAAFLQRYQQVDALRQRMHYEYAAALYMNDEKVAALTAMREIVATYDGLGLSGAEDGARVDDALFFVGVLEGQAGNHAEALATYADLVEAMPHSNRAPAALATVMRMLIDDERESWRAADEGTGEAVDYERTLQSYADACMGAYANTLEAGCAVVDFIDYLCDKDARCLTPTETTARRIELLVDEMKMAAPAAPATVRAMLHLIRVQKGFGVEQTREAIDDVVTWADLTDDRTLWLDARETKAEWLKQHGEFAAAHDQYAAMCELALDDYRVARARHEGLWALMEDERVRSEAGEAVDHSATISPAVEELVATFPTRIEASRAIDNYAGYLSRRGYSKAETAAEIRPLAADVRVAAAGTDVWLDMTRVLARHLPAENVDEAVALLDDAIAEADAAGNDWHRIGARYNRATCLREAKRYREAYDDLVAVYEKLPRSEHTTHALADANRVLMEEEHDDWTPVNGIPHAGVVDHVEAMEANVARLVGDGAPELVCRGAMMDLANYHWTRVRWNPEQRVASYARIYDVADEIQRTAPGTPEAVRAKLHQVGVLRHEDLPEALRLVDEVIVEARAIGAGVEELDGNIVKAKLLNQAGERPAARELYLHILEHEIDLMPAKHIRDVVEWELALEIGFTLYGDEDYESALQVFTDVAYEEESEDARSGGLLHRAMALEKLRRRSEAVAAYQELLRAYPDSAAVPAAEPRLRRLEAQGN